MLKANENIVLSSIRIDGGIEMEYARKGMGDRSVLLIHGYGDSWYSFSGVLDTLPTEYSAVAVSLRGHGESSKPLSGYAISDYVDDLVAFATALKLGPSIVVGHSMGTFIARELALRMPELVTHLILIDSAATADNAVLRGLYDDIADLKDPVSRTFVHDFQAGTCVTPPNGGMTIERIVDESMKLPAYVWRKALKGLLEYRSPESEFPELAEINAPTLIIWGTFDEIFPREQQDILLQKIRSARIVVFDEAGHAPNWEFPAKVARAIVDFASDTM